MTALAHTHRPPYGTHISMSPIAPVMAGKVDVVATRTVGTRNVRFTADIHALVARRAL